MYILSLQIVPNSVIRKRSLFAFQIGTYLKVPRLPIWVADIRDHYCVLFALNRDLLSNWRTERRFDLYLCDGLLRHSGPIRLSIG